jgi:hypothetical protein
MLTALPVALYGYIGTPIVARANIFALIFTGVIMMIILVTLGSWKLDWREPAAPIFAILILVIIFSTAASMRDATMQYKCLIFNESYPGVAGYDECVSNIKLSDYVDAALAK